VNNIEPNVINLKRKKTAIVLGGGGITGGVYEIGVLKALDDFITNKSLNDFDIFVGTSVGSSISAALANRITPNELFNSLVGKSTRLSPLTSKDIFKLNFSEFFGIIPKIPIKFYQAFFNYLKNRKDEKILDVIIDFIYELLPNGLFTTDGIEKYVKNYSSHYGYTDNFHELVKELYITSCDLNTGQRIIFGESKTRDIPISRAIAGSIAMPLFYKPVKIKGRELVDGGVKRTLHLDIAIKHGAKLIICINPIVPFTFDYRKIKEQNTNPRFKSIGELGLLNIINQVFRMMIHARVELGIHKVREENPDVDIILIEPKKDDLKMFSYNMMKYSARVTIAEHGFLDAREKIKNKFDHYKEILARHDINLTNRFVDEEYTEMENEDFSLSSIVKTLGKINIFKH
jgi:predicted acylesterase/phospholipase RssA